MAVIITPNMSLQIPTVGTELGPNYAVDVNNSLITIDGHTHQPGSGVAITPGAININSDLAFNNNRGTLFKSVTFTPQSIAPPGITPDIAALQVSGVDLYYTDASGNVIRITQGGGVAGSPGSITGLVPPASASYNSGSTTFVWQSDVNTPAAMDNGPVTIRNIVANSFGVTLGVNASIGADYNATLPAAAPSTTQILTMDPSGNIIANTDPNVVNPSGSITMYGGAAAPAGWILCDGSPQSRTTFANLFATIGTAYGVGDGTTTFNVPDFRGIFPRGVDSGAGNDPDTGSRTATNGGNSGDSVGSLQTDQFRSHTHPFDFYVLYGDPGGSFPASSVGGAVSGLVNGVTAQTGGNETRPINLYVNFIIKT
jgi:hypothetical protein